MKSRKLFVILILLSSVLLVGCAAPKGDGPKLYHLNVIANCYATGCDIKQTVTVTIAADVKKDQKAEATQNTDVSATGL